MKKGGYQIVDLKDVSLSGTPTTIKGIYKTLVGNSRKVILLSGINIEGVKKNDTFTRAYPIGVGRYRLEYENLADIQFNRTSYITITSNDAVSVDSYDTDGVSISSGQTIFTVKE